MRNLIPQSAKLLLRRNNMLIVLFSKRKYNFLDKRTTAKHFSTLK